jgi:hypothetical protein
MLPRLINNYRIHWHHNMGNCNFMFSCLYLLWFYYNHEVFMKDIKPRLCSFSKYFVKRSLYNFRLHSISYKPNHQISINIKLNLNSCKDTKLLWTYLNKCQAPTDFFIRVCRTISTVGYAYSVDIFLVFNKLGH